MAGGREEGMADTLLPAPAGAHGPRHRLFVLELSPDTQLKTVNPRGSVARRVTVSDCGWAPRSRHTRQ